MLSSSLLFLFTVLTPALCCDWLRHYDHYSNTSLTLVRRMVGQVTHHEAPVSFPYRFYSCIRHTEVKSQLVFIRDSLSLISDLYHHDNISSVPWETKLTHRFLIDIDSMIDGLNTCVSMQKRADTRLKKYYKRLVRRTVYCTGRSSESWQTLIRETKLHLDQLQLLVSSILHPSAAANRRRCPPHTH
ncbi:interferon a3-like [Solea solea]|uniref:interferon a3-like n=1 Tax=Solea solea TaxID=90069 RepID=UPI00272C2668|nr:interferon a3-like [Solea solea]